MMNLPVRPGLGRTGQSLAMGFTVVTRPVLLPNCANFPPIALFGAFDDCQLERSAGKANASRGDRTEAVGARAPVQYGVAAAVLRPSVGRAWTPMVRH
jgi:hypothetical protein